MFLLINSLMCEHKLTGPDKIQAKLPYTYSHKKKLIDTDFMIINKYN